MFVSLEGIDGSGKTTQAQRLAAYFESQGRRVVLVREPGGTRLGEAIRAMLLGATYDIHPRAELLLFSSARAHLVETVIRPALAAGDVVVADRFYDSTTAYQGGGRGVINLAEADTFHAFVTGGLVPDRTVLVDVPVDVARRRRSGTSADRIEAQDEAFHERVRAAYLALAERYPERIAVVDGQADREHVWTAVRAVFDPSAARDARP